MKKLWMGLLAGMLCLSACTANPAPNEDENNAAKPAELLISAAASMTDCLTELAELYKAAAPNVTLTLPLVQAALCRVKLKRERLPMCLSAPRRNR